MSIVLFYSNFGKTNTQLFTTSFIWEKYYYYILLSITSRSYWWYILPSSRINSKNASLFGTKIPYYSLPSLYSKYDIFIHTFYEGWRFIHIISSFINRLIPYSIDRLIPYFIDHLVLTLSAHSTICSLFNLSPHDHPTRVILLSFTTTLQKNTPLFLTFFI
jgi:hypothetical protein